MGPADKTVRNPVSSSSDTKERQLKDFYVQYPAVIGRGHYAKVFRGKRRSDGRVVAIKVIDKAKTQLSNLKTEIKVMQKVGSNKYIVELYDVFTTPRKLILVMEYMNGGELFEQLVENGQYEEAEAAKVIRNLAFALKAMHDVGIVHRDIKPENLLLDKEGNVKLADFGLAKIMDEDTMHTVCGTWAYCAPEVKGHRPYTANVDVWSIGVIAFILLSGYHPFDPEGILEDEELDRRIQLVQFDFKDPAWEHASDKSKDFIRRCLVGDPAVRYDIEDVIAHPWLNMDSKIGKKISEKATKNMQTFVSKHRARRQMKSAMLATKAALHMAKFSSRLAQK